MKLYTSLGPNPAVVNAYLAQKGHAIETVMTDITKSESRREPYVGWNPAGTMPLLEIRQGLYVAESIAICEYLDELVPGDSLIGSTAEERAITRMWIRRIDLAFVQPSSSAWRYGLGVEFCRDHMHVIPHAVDDFQTIASHGIRWIERQMRENHFVCGDRLTLADLLLFVFVEFREASGVDMGNGLPWIVGWRKRLRQMPLARAVPPVPNH